MSFPSPLFIQNRNHYTAAQEIGRGVPLILTPDGKQVTPATSATDSPIGISTNNYRTGEVVEMAWIGFTDIAITGCVPGDQIRLNASGAASKDGDGTYLGVAAGKSIGAFTVVRIGLLGYAPPEGGGGGSPLVPMNIQQIEVTDPYGKITLPASDLSESQFIMVTGNQLTQVAFSGTMDMDAPVGTQIITNFLVFNENLAPEIELSFSDPGMNLFGNRYATNRDGVAAWTLTATRVNLDMGGDIMDGWFVVSDPIRQAVPADGVTYDADSRWPDPRPANVSDALDELVDRMTYVPDVPGDWTAYPADVKGALDELAGRMQAEETKPSPSAEDIPYTITTPPATSLPPSDVKLALDQVYFTATALNTNGASALSATVPVGVSIPAPITVQKVLDDLYAKLDALELRITALEP